MNPVPLMPLVERIRGQATADATMEVAADLCVRLGETSVEARDYPGFIANHPAADDQRSDVRRDGGRGYPEAVDTVAKLALNHPMGPLQLADLIGLDVCLAILTVLQDGYGDPKYRPCPLLRRMVAARHLGRKSGRGFYSYDESGQLARAER